MPKAARFQSIPLNVIREYLLPHLNAANAARFGTTRKEFRNTAEKHVEATKVSNQRYILHTFKQTTEDLLLKQLNRIVPARQYGTYPTIKSQQPAPMAFDMINLIRSVQCSTRLARDGMLHIAFQYGVVMPGPGGSFGYLSDFECHAHTHPLPRIDLLRSSHNRLQFVSDPNFARMHATLVGVVDSAIARFNRSMMYRYVRLPARSTRQKRKRRD